MDPDYNGDFNGVDEFEITEYSDLALIHQSLHEYGEIHAFNKKLQLSSLSVNPYIVLGSDNQFLRR